MAWMPLFYAAAHLQLCGRGCRKPLQSMQYQQPKTMKKTKMIVGTLLIGALAGFTGCKKNETLPTVEPQAAAGNVSSTDTEAPSTSARMWMAGKSIMGVSHNSSMQASLYRF